MIPVTARVHYFALIKPTFVLWMAANLAFTVKNKYRLGYRNRRTEAVEKIIMILSCCMSQDLIKVLLLPGAGTRWTAEKYKLLLLYFVIYSWKMTVPTWIQKNSAHSEGCLESRTFKETESNYHGEYFQDCKWPVKLWSELFCFWHRTGFGCPVSLRCSERETTEFILAVWYKRAANLSLWELTWVWFTRGGL